MSIIGGLEATIMLLRERLAKSDTITDMLILQSLEKTEQINTVHERCEELMKQNDELSDRIHLDLDPRIARMIETGERNHGQYCESLAKQTRTIEEQSVRIKRCISEIQAFDEMNNELRNKLELARSGNARLRVHHDELNEKLDKIHEECVR